MTLEDFPNPSGFTLKVKAATELKRKPISASALIESDRKAIPMGSTLPVDAFEVVRDHLRVFLPTEPETEMRDMWYVPRDVIEVFQDEVRVFPKQTSNLVKLNVPYKSQLDNFYNPTGSANITAIAMCLAYLGVARKSDSGQLEDELYEYTDREGWDRRNPHDLARLVAAYGAKDCFVQNATLAEVRDWVADGNPAATHGYFTTFGHAVAIAGYDEAGLYVHDPLGKWTPEGYIGGQNGAHTHHSYRLIRQLCMPDGNFWVHFITR